ncbi:MAG: FtsX-like permease family protein [Candidatus Dormibacteria bacterium]
MSALWPLAWRALRARPLRSLLTLAAVALGVAVIIGVQAALAGLDQQARDAQALRAGAAELDVRTTAGRALTPAQLAAIGSAAGVREAAPLLEKRVATRADISGDALEALLVGVSRNGLVALRTVDLRSGRLPRVDATNEVAVDAGLAAALGDGSTKLRRAVRVGDSILLTTGTGPDRFRVVGLTAGTSGGAAFTHSAVFAGAATVERAFGLGLHSPLVAVRLAPGASAGTVAQAIRRDLHGAVSVVDPRAGGAEPLHDLRPLLLLVTALSIVIGAGVTANSVSLGIYERRREIGLLRAAGASASQVIRLLAIEVALCALAGGVAGVGLGYLAGGALVRAYSAADLPAPRAGVSATLAVAAALIGVVVAVAGGLLPAVAAGRIPPLAAVRPAANAGREPLRRPVIVAAAMLGVAGTVLLLSGSGVLVAVGAALLLGAVAAAMPLLAPPVVRLLGLVASPLSWQAPMAAAGLARRRNRTALTTAGLMTATAVAVAVSALTAGALSESDHWISRILVGDAVIHSGVTQRDDLAKNFQNQRGVRLVSSIRFFAETVDGGPVGFAAIDPAIYADREGLDIVGDRTTALVTLAAQPSVLVPRQMADAEHLHRGSHLRAGTGPAAVELSVAGVVEHSLPGGDGRETLMIDRRLAVASFGDQARGFDDLQVVTDGDLLPTLQGVAARYGMQAVSIDAVRGSAQQAIEHSVGLLLALSGVAVLIAMLAVVNTLLVNVRQAARELSLLRAVGMARQRALRLILAEAALLAATGAAVGVAAGCLVAAPMLRVSAVPGFTPGFVFPVSTAATVVAAVVGGAILATVVPAIRAVRASIVAGIRYE